MSKVPGLELLYRMMERNNRQDIRLKDLEVVLLTVIEMEKEKENAKV